MNTGWLQIDAAGDVPKYEQIVKGVTEAIRRKTLRKGAEIPSISRVSDEHDLARETVAKAYRRLRCRGIIHSIPSKGYYVASESIEHTVRVFLLLNAFNLDNRVLYEAFHQRLGDLAQVDLFFHHYNIDEFRRLIQDNVGRYEMYVIKPFDHESIPEVLEEVEKENLLVLDRKDYLQEEYMYVGQDFDGAVFDCLESEKERFLRYSEINVVCPASMQHPVATLNAIRRFCRRHQITYRSCKGLADVKIKPEVVYFSFFDEDLAGLLEKCEISGLKIGRDIGIVAYNDTPLKKYIAGGLTVISTDFERMGKTAADFVLDRTVREQVIPTSLIIRKSL